MADFNKAIVITLKNEGGYINDPLDKGGETKYGISKKSYPDLDIKSLSIEQAKEIYKKDFWDCLKCNFIENQKLANKIFDMSVLMGIKNVVKKLQLVICLKYCVNITIDGIIGIETLNYINGHKSDIIYEEFIKQLDNYLHDLNKPKYIQGWIKRLYS